MTPGSRDGADRTEDTETGASAATESGADAATETGAAPGTGKGATATNEAGVAVTNERGGSDAIETGGSGGAETARFDWRGWTLVAAVAVAFFVVPAAILYLPAARDVIQSLGLTMRDAYLVLPLLPAFGLGALAVWSAMRARSA